MDYRVLVTLPHLFNDPVFMALVVMVIIIENIIIGVIVAKITRHGMIISELERFPDRAKYHIKIRDNEIRRLKRELGKQEQIIETLMERLQGARAWAILINHRFDVATAQLVKITEGVKGVNIKKIQSGA